MGSFKNVLEQYHLITDGSMGGNLTSGALNIRYLDNIGIQFIWTSTPVGDFFVDVSIDGVWQGNVYTGVTWTALTITGASPAGSASSYYYDLNQLGAPAMRVRYVRGSSTGTAQVYVSGKSL